MNNPLGSIGTASLAARALGNLMLVTPKVVGYQPKNPSTFLEGSALPPPIIFHYEAEQSANLRSDITDHYVEDNTPAEDHIALRPEIIKTQGFVGELTDILEPEFLGLRVPGTAGNILSTVIQEIPSKLEIISAYAPGLSATALNQYNQAKFIFDTAKQVAQSGVAAWSSWSTLFGGQGVQNKQQIFFAQFYGYWKARTLFSVQTPWAMFDNMAIESCVAVQGGDTDEITDFEVTFKMIRFASTTTRLNGVIDITNYQGRLRDQVSDVYDGGTSSLTESPVSFSDSIARIA